MTRVAVCLPTYNEAENVALMLDAVLGVFDENGIDGRILVIDDASPDGTAEIVDERARTDPRVAVLRRAQKEGLGLAYRGGFRHVLSDGAETIVQMDCDFSHDPAVIPAMLDALGEADLVLGSRYVGGGGVVGWPLVRQAISKGGCLYARLVLGIPVRDLTGGFKAWRSGVVEYLLGRSIDARGYGFQIQMTYEAILAGYRVREIPIVFRERVRGESKMSVDVVREAALMVPRLRLAARRR
ncbi:MAG TPA: polyprenol monophosphomannose synthase [Gaiellaceae bacterium]|jgi:dolichol-phosphate mannosyltransferase